MSDPTRLTSDPLPLTSAFPQLTSDPPQLTSDPTPSLDEALDKLLAMSLSQEVGVEKESNSKLRS